MIIGGCCHNRANKDKGLPEPGREDKMDWRNRVMRQNPQQIYLYR